MAKKKKAPHPTRIFKTTDALADTWQDYKDSIKEQEKEWKKVQYVGRNGDRVEDTVKVPLTFEGFKRYCWDEGLGAIEKYFTNQGGYYDEFGGICSRIKNEIRENQIIGGMNGFFNPSITQRLNNLSEKTENKNTHEVEIFKGIDLSVQESNEKKDIKD